jgi:hypothetical protein
VGELRLAEYLLSVLNRARLHEYVRVFRAGGLEAPTDSVHRLLLAVARRVTGVRTGSMRNKLSGKYPAFDRKAASSASSASAASSASSAASASAEAEAAIAAGAALSNVDADRAARVLLREFRAGSLGRLTLDEVHSEEAIARYAAAAAASQAQRDPHRRRTERQRREQDQAATGRAGSKSFRLRGAAAAKTAV